ncbi:MAG: HAD family hydrolase [Minisyncoccia bacterium]
MGTSKKVVFLDGDGTIWYPKSTKRTQKPHWVYNHPEIKRNYLEHMELAPKIIETLQTLNSLGVQLVLVSANPSPPKIAELELLEKLEYFNILNFFTSYHSSAGDDPMGKTSVILKVISSMGIKKDQALMIGDSYFYDYQAAKDSGIDAYWIRNNVTKNPEEFPKDLKALNEVYEILDLYDWK